MRSVCVLCVCMCVCVCACVCVCMCVWVRACVPVRARLTFPTYPGIAVSRVFGPEAGPDLCKVNVFGQGDSNIKAEPGTAPLAGVGAIMATPDLQKHYAVGKSSYVSFTSFNNELSPLMFLRHRDPRRVCKSV